MVWACVVAAVGSGWVLLGARTSNDITLPGTETQAATDFLAKEFPPQQNGQSPVVFHAAAGTLLDPAARRAIEATVRRMKAVPHVTSVTSPFARGARSLLMSEDEKTAIVQVLLDVNGGQVTRELAGQVMATAGPARDAGLQVEAGGVLGVRLSEERSRRPEMIGLAAGVVILAITFGALVAAGMPIITAIVALVTGLGLIGLLGHVVGHPGGGADAGDHARARRAASTTPCSSSSASATNCTAAPTCVRPWRAPWPRRAAPWCSPASP